MPCWQVNRLIYQKLEIRPAILKKTIPLIREELQRLGTPFTLSDVAGKVSIMTSGGNYTLDPKTGQAQFREGQEAIHDLVKRCYSMATVQSVAARSAVFRAFKTKKIDNRTLVMTRR